jgi:hypothetical protein
MASQTQEIVHIDVTKIIFWFLFAIVLIIGDPDILDRIIDIMNSFSKLILTYAESLV